MLDPRAIAEIRELQAPGQVDLLAEMVGAFLADAPTYIAMMTGALARGDGEALARGAHALKSGAGYLGALELQQLCIQLELLGTSEPSEAWPALAEPLRIVFERARLALSREIAADASA